MCVKEVRGTEEERAKLLRPLSPVGIGHTHRSDHLDDNIIWSDSNLNHVFKRLFHFAIDLPKELYEDFKDYDIISPEIVYRRLPRIKK